MSSFPVACFPPTRVHPRAAAIQLRVAPIQNQILNHRLHSQLGDLHGVRLFAEHHCYAVWDCMSLLKALQRRLTCQSVPWVPLSNAWAVGVLQRFLAEEEADERPDGAWASHFEMYVAAMVDLGADVRRVEGLLERLGQGSAVIRAITEASIPPPSAAFVAKTLETCILRRTHEIAAEYVFGRRELVPPLYRQIVTRIGGRDLQRCGTFLYYLDRHIPTAPDSWDSSGLQLLSAICGDDAQLWNEAEICAVRALQERLLFWDGIDAAISLSRMRQSSSAPAY